MKKPIFGQIDVPVFIQNTTTMYKATAARNDRKVGFAFLCMILGIFLLYSPATAQDERKLELVRLKNRYGDESVYVTIDSLKQGLWVEYDSLGRRVFEICYKDDKENGPFIIYYPDGNVSQTINFIDGVVDGEVVNYYRDGTVELKTNYNMGLRDGIREEYTEDGRLDKRYLYRNDTLIRILVDNHLLPPIPVPPAGSTK